MALMSERYFSKQIKNLGKKPSKNTRTITYNIWKENSLDGLIPNWRKQKKASVNLKTHQQESSKPKIRKKKDGLKKKKKEETKLGWPVRQHKAT